MPGTTRTGPRYWLSTVKAGDSVKKLLGIKGCLQFAIDEFDHYILLARAYEHVASGKGLSIQEMCHIDEGKKMIEMRQAYRDQPHGDATVELTEGGGLGLYFGIRSAFNRKRGQELSPLDRCIQDFAEATIRDETEHMTGRFLKMIELEVSEGEWEIIDRNLQELFAQKLRERNQQFSSVFNDDELEAMGRDIESGRQYVRSHLSFLAERLNVV